MYFATVRRVVRIGKSLSFILPSEMARFLGITSDTVFYVYVDDGRIVYSVEQPSVWGKRVKARVQARHGSKEYYVVTVPAEYSAALGISEGSSILLRCYDRVIVVEPADGDGEA